MIFYSAGRYEPFCVTSGWHTYTSGTGVTLTLQQQQQEVRGARGYSWLWLDHQLLTANLFSPHKGALKFKGAIRLKYVWTKEVLDDNLGCRPLKSLYTISDMQMHVWIWLLIKFSWTSTFLCWKTWEISHLPDPNGNFLISVSLSTFLICRKLPLSYLSMHCLY